MSSHGTFLAKLLGTPLKKRSRKKVNWKCRPLELRLMDLRRSEHMELSFCYFQAGVCEENTIIRTSYFAKLVTPNLTSI